MLKRTCLVTAAILGLGALANGTFMLVSPAAWYVSVPGVTTTGPFNQHFIRDIGIIFLFLGAAFLAGAARPTFRVMLWGGATLWLTCHALFHFWEVAVGICGPTALIRDFPAVTLPAVLGALLTLWAAVDTRSSRVRAAQIAFAYNRTR
ncbi:hypothetical protein [Sphingosinicella sp. CPCC 101087]|uniref:hypothetical protein n=1 Tax=Sphingosinicella sp. CPCC 101087 TaxID=2497754 RepID=UPI00101D002E|nr:hypothetical protein [Sphingosinicella sp. CPCC 101087]